MQTCFEMSIPLKLVVSPIGLKSITGGAIVPEDGMHMSLIIVTLFGVVAQITEE